MDEISKICNDNENYRSTGNAIDKIIEEITVFLSYDITDSTKLKYKHPKGWASIIHLLLKAKEDFNLMNFWKFNGDEVLFRCNISSVEFLCSLIETAFIHLESMQDRMQQVINDISVKGTIWIALTSNSLEEYKNNYRFIVRDEMDFSGRNIDEGFRLTKCSSMKKIAIDPKIVYILLHFIQELDNGTASLNAKERTLCRKIKEILGKIHFIDDVCCKGVWDDKPYPVYWYYETDKLSGIRYGEFLNGVHLWQKDLMSLDKNCTDISETMKSMFFQVGVLSDVEAIINKLEYTGEPTRNWAGKVNLYFMVACINPITGSVLIAQRGKERKHLKGVWDFGNVKYQNIVMKEVIQSTYEDLFGINISIIEDEMRGGNIKPFGYCTVYRNHLPHNGIMCYAFIQNSQSLSDEEIVKHIKQHITSHASNGESTNYQDVTFVSIAKLSSEEFSFSELTLDEIRSDSQAAPNNLDYTDKNKSIMYFKASIQGAMSEWKKAKDAGLLT